MGGERCGDMPREGGQDGDEMLTAEQTKTWPGERDEG